MSDIVERLKREEPNYPLCNEAADEIERLTAELDRVLSTSEVEVRAENERLRRVVEAARYERDGECTECGADYHCSSCRCDFCNALNALANGQ